MTAAGLASGLEGRREGREWRCRCPVHGGRSLSITEKDGRLLLVCRAGCPQGDVIKAIRDMGLWGNSHGYEKISPPAAPGAKDEEERQRRIDKGDDLWDESHPIEPGDPVHRYLAGRGITLESWPKDLRCHPSLPYWQVDDRGKPVKTGAFPAMIAVVRSPEGRSVGLHRTWVRHDGLGKAPVVAPKKIYKVHDMTGGAVRLFPPEDGLLGICEGIEDALSALILWNIPTWAALGTSGLIGFAPPEAVRELLIFADRDENGAGQKAAWELADRMAETERAARVLVPGDGSKDLNAYLLARRGANMQEIAR